MLYTCKRLLFALIKQVKVNESHPECGQDSGKDSIAEMMTLFKLHLNTGSPCLQVRLFGTLLTLDVVDQHIIQTTSIQVV